jgi:drug/metabolite transporter (DMT)-like permease
VDFDARTVLAILYVGVCASLAAFVLWNKARRQAAKNLEKYLHRFEK